MAAAIFETSVTLNDMAWGRTTAWCERASERPVPNEARNTGDPATGGAHSGMRQLMKRDPGAQLGGTGCCRKRDRQTGLQQHAQFEATTARGGMGVCSDTRSQFEPGQPGGPGQSVRGRSFRRARRRAGPR